MLSLLLTQAEDEVQGLFSDICSPSSFDQAEMVSPLFPGSSFQQHHFRTTLAAMAILPILMRLGSPCLSVR